MLRDGKEKVLEKITQTLKEYENFILTDYKGLSVEEITNLRTKLREHGVIYQITKNRLLKIATQNANITGLDEYLLGPTAVLYAKDDVVQPAKVIMDYQKQKKVKVKGGYIQGQSVDKEAISAYSKLPSLEELYAKMLGGLQSPIAGFTRCMAGPMTNLARCLNQIAEQKGES